MRATRSLIAAVALVLLTLVIACQDRSAEQPPAASDAVPPPPPAPRDPDVATAAADPSHTTGLPLPATFRGELPCADCPGIRYHLDLWPDGVFHLRQTYLGEEGGTSDDLGLWRKDPVREAIYLHGGREAPLGFEITGPRNLRLLAVDGSPIASELPYDLATDGALAPAEVSLSLRGTFTYLADAPRLRICRTGRSYPVAMEGDYLALERAYLAADRPGPGTPLLASLEVTIAVRPGMEGDTRVASVVVREFGRLWPGQSCSSPLTEVSLANQYWRILTLAGEPASAEDARREPHLILDGQANRYLATIGCNQLRGAYRVNGPEISFQPGAATRMACPPPLDGLEQRLEQALQDAAAWRVAGHTLVLSDLAGAPVATCEVVILR